MNKMTHKTNKPNIIPKKITKLKPTPTPNAKWVEDYVNCLSFKTMPMSDEGLTRFATDLVAWAKDDKRAYRIYDFALSKGVSVSAFKTWVVKYPVIAQAHETAMNFIASRREIGALERQLSEKMVLQSLHQFDPDALEAAKFHASLKAEADSNSKSNVQFVAVPIGMPEFPSSPLVPIKKDKE